MPYQVVNYCKINDIMKFIEYHLKQSLNQINQSHQISSNYPLLQSNTDLQHAHFML